MAQPEQVAYLRTRARSALLDGSRCFDYDHAIAIGNSSSADDEF